MDSREWIQRGGTAVKARGRCGNSSVSAEYSNIFDVEIKETSRPNVGFGGWQEYALLLREPK
jgi:hypothetical protein